jgi:hypothetical protein
MYVTTEEFLDMLHQIRERYRGSHYNLRDPEVMHTLLLREFPEVEGVIPPPSYESIRERYIPEEWRMLIPESRRNAPALSEIRPGEEGSLTDPVAEWCRQVVADLDTLRGDTFAAVTYVVDRSMGMDSDEAMDRARATGQLIQIVAMSSRRSYLRSISGTTGRPRIRSFARYHYTPEPTGGFEIPLPVRTGTPGVAPSPVPGAPGPAPAAPSPGPAAPRTPLPMRPVSTAVRPGYPARLLTRGAPPRTTAPVRRQPAPPSTSASPAQTRRRLQIEATRAGSSRRL